MESGLVILPQLIFLNLSHNLITHLQSLLLLFNVKSISLQSHKRLLDLSFNPLESFAYETTEFTNSTSDESEESLLIPTTSSSKW